MDGLATLGVFLLSFVLCALLVAAVSFFGAKEKTYEEALEEQKRKLAQEHGGGKAASGKKAKAAKAAKEAVSREGAKIEKRKNARAQARKEKVSLAPCQGSFHLFLLRSGSLGVDPRVGQVIFFEPLFSVRKAVGLPFLPSCARV